MLEGAGGVKRRGPRAVESDPEASERAQLVARAGLGPADHRPYF